MRTASTTVSATPGPPNVLSVRSMKNSGYRWTFDAVPADSRTRHPSASTNKSSALGAAASEGSSEKCKECALRLTTFSSRNGYSRCVCAKYASSAAAITVGVGSLGGSMMCAASSPIMLRTISVLHESSDRLADPSGRNDVGNFI